MIPEYSFDPITHFNASQYISPIRSRLFRWSHEHDDTAPPPPYSGPQRFKLRISENFWDPMDESIGAGNMWPNWWGFYNRRIYYMMFYDNYEFFKTKGPLLYYFDVTRPRPGPGPGPTPGPIGPEGPVAEKPEIKPFRPRPDENKL